MVKDRRNFLVGTTISRFDRSPRCSKHFGWSPSLNSGSWQRKINIYNTNVGLHQKLRSVYVLDQTRSRLLSRTSFGQRLKQKKKLFLRKAPHLRFRKQYSMVTFFQSNELRSMHLKIQRSKSLQEQWQRTLQWTPKHLKLSLQSNPTYSVVKYSKPRRQSVRYRLEYYFD